MEDICKMIKSHKENKGKDRFTMLTKNHGDKIFPSPDSYPSSINTKYFSAAKSVVENDGDRDYAWYETQGYLQLDNGLVDYEFSLRLYEDGEAHILFELTTDDEDRDLYDYESCDPMPEYVSSASDVDKFVEEFIRESLYDTDLALENKASW